VQYKDSKRLPTPSEKLGCGLLVLSGFFEELFSMALARKRHELV
jgi:hypothetical protein